VDERQKLWFGIGFVSQGFYLCDAGIMLTLWFCKTIVPQWVLYTGTKGFKPEKGVRVLSYFLYCLDQQYKKYDKSFGYLSVMDKAN